MNETRASFSVPTPENFNQKDKKTRIKLPSRENNSHIHRQDITTEACFLDNTALINRLCIR